MYLQNRLKTEYTEEKLFIFYNSSILYIMYDWRSFNNLIFDMEKSTNRMKS